MAGEFDYNLNMLSRKIRDVFGLDYPVKKHSELRQRLVEIAKNEGYEDVQSFTSYVLNNFNKKTTRELLVTGLTNNETYFWRDRELFKVLNNVVLPGIIEQKRLTDKTIRIWSAASSSGEEAYSVAIILQRLLPDIKDWFIYILGTDVNLNQIQKARIGKYSNWSFRDVPVWLKDNYFIANGRNEFMLSDQIRRMVQFDYLNLVEDQYPSMSKGVNNFDLILCRNVLIYFGLKQIKVVTDKMHDCLHSDGYFVTSASETYEFISPRFSHHRIGNVSFYRQDQHKPLDKEKKMRNDHARQMMKPPAESSRIRESSKLNRRRVRSYSTGSIFSAEQRKGQKTDEDAFPTAQQASDEAARTEDPLFMKAQELANDRKPDEAIKACEEALKINKLNPKLYKLKALVELEKGEDEIAYESLKKSFFLDSSSVSTNYYLGDVAKTLSKHKESTKYYANALMLISHLDDDETLSGLENITAGLLKEILNNYLD